MKVKLMDIVGAKKALDLLLQTPLSTIVSYRLSRLLSKLREEEGIYQDKRFELIRKYGEEDRERSPGTWKVIPGKAKEFSDENYILLNEEVDVSMENCLIPLEILKDVSIPGEAMKSLFAFIVDNSDLVKDTSQRKMDNEVSSPEELRKMLGESKVSSKQEKKVDES